MAKKDLTLALDAVESTYAQVVDIANQMTEEMFESSNRLIKQLDDVNTLSVDELRWYIVQIQLRAFELSETREKSALKATLAESLQKEKFALRFNEAEGAAAVKNNIALIGSAEESVVEALYELVASLIKSKVDQCQRLVDCLKSVLVSRMQEAKLTQNAIE